MADYIIIIVAIALGLYLIRLIFALIKSLRNAGRVGESYVARQLRRLPRRRYFVINDLLLNRGNGFTSQIDHVVVSPYGVFVIETKNIYGNIRGSENAKLWRSTYRDRDLSFDNPILQNEAHIKALKAVIWDEEIRYIPIIAFSTNAQLRNLAARAHVIYWDQVRNIIRLHREQIMTIERAKQIYELLLKVNISYKNARQQHAERAKINKEEYKQRVIESVADGKCPRCGGQLVKRRGKYSSFYGCVNYPSCQFTQPAAE